MKVGIIQSSYIPWRGYFDFIASVDIFVFYDDVQYTTRDWRNRNRLKTPRGTEWITVPVSHQSRSKLICETLIDLTTPWTKKHLRTWELNYRKSPNFNIATELLAEINDPEQTTISKLNIKLIHRICDYLEIKTPMILSSELSLKGRRTERLIEILKKLNATTYLSGPNADAYLDKDLFREYGIQLEYKSYDYTPYPQLWGEFIGDVTVLDLVANCGADAKKFLQSRTPDRVVVPK
ncbi:WbqC family protein [Solidesulfovibrio carbinolicus]|uniref:WbqC family protein n=1 Tax=Solidesulfovibrio carbinolicus TaxID=296842 RepID=UPI0013EC848C|nr:WbqC family protein [Solidesulfovibrio carbinolicus]